MRGRAVRFVGQSGELLGAGGLALETPLHEAAMLWLFKDYTHLVHGVSMTDKLDMCTTISGNFSGRRGCGGGRERQAAAARMARQASTNGSARSAKECGGARAFLTHSDGTMGRGGAERWGATEERC